MKKGSRNRRLVFVKWAEPVVAAIQPCCTALLQVRSHHFARENGCIVFTRHTTGVTFERGEGQ
jgi:hypothetical protein